ncbi:hypothetical protein [Taibaiella soli]|uniref:Uncharacterized protein n=1 Tax=Taibaiella soli TaxID=1649169 RepID=A0A2W2AIY0_9BACT|nr:hypothetical protein [Taibaiella soli]PZF73532.1 hypothetical protein DN068_07345 [Taibaiella soli]
MNAKPYLNNASRLSFAIAGLFYLPMAFLLFHWINYRIGLWMGYPVSFYWKGSWLPCVNLKKFIKTHPEVNLNHFAYIYWVALILWPVAGVLIRLISRKVENAVGTALQWLGVIMIVTPLYHVVIELANIVVFSIQEGGYHFNFHMLPYYLLFVCLVGGAVLMYQMSFGKEGRQKLWLISFPVFVACWWLWFFVIGRRLLP